MTQFYQLTLKDVKTKIRQKTVTTSAFPCLKLSGINVFRRPKGYRFARPEGSPLG